LKFTYPHQKKKDDFRIVENSAVDQHRFDTDPNPDPTFHFDADPDFTLENPNFFSQRWQFTLFIVLVSGP
jgi:hypothetical protein